jgi:TolB-like protein/cytochrome c-type biogenesis protein CcmH/NrfG
VTESTHAVFLSYASQDAEAAHRICAALRAAGIQVFLDQSELRGGDAWDHKIRHEILDCVLFIPIVSRHTQERLEGYFRHEWKLAIERAHHMAEQKAFLLPVVLDDIRDQEAIVPDPFRAVQWTRLPGGETPPAFVERVRRLLSPEGSRTIRGPASAQSGAAAITRAPAQPSWLPGRGLLVVLALIVGAVVYFAIEKLWISKPAVPAPEIAASAAPAEPPAAVAESSAPAESSPAVAASTEPAASSAPAQSIAVLPFADLSDARDQEYLSDGLSEELIDLLARVPDLRVPARTSSFYFKGKSEPLATIARTLGVANVLEGSVRKDGNQLRVTAQLTRADSGEHLWSATYDRELKDVFKVQDEIAAAVVGALKLKPAPAQSAGQAYGTTNTEAYTQYLLGRQLYFRENDAVGFGEAVNAYQKAIALDPKYAAAYAGLALAKAFRADVLGDTTKGIADARADAEKAVALGPQQPEGYTARGFIRFNWGWDWSGAQADFEKALALDAGNADARRRYVSLLTTLGRMPQALAEGKRASELDPLNADSWRGLAVALDATGNHAAAVEALHRALEIQPGDTYSTYSLAVMELTGGQAAEALETFRKVDLGGFRLAGIAMADCALHRGSESQRAFKDAIAKSARESAYQIAEAYAWCGDKDQALQWLERAYRQRDTGLFEITWSPLLVSLRGDPRFTALLGRMNFPQQTASR